MMLYFNEVVLFSIKQLQNMRRQFANFTRTHSHHLASTVFCSAARSHSTVVHMDMYYSASRARGSTSSAFTLSNQSSLLLQSRERRRRRIQSQFQRWHHQR